MSERRTADRLVWVDCEMTGLDLARDALIEVAVVVTDSELHPLDNGLDLVIHADDELLDAMIPVVRDMHTASGLTEAARASRISTAQAEDEVIAYIRRFVPEPGTAPLCGNSIATDRGFLNRDMPGLDAYLHYRMVDVSSIKELARRWYPRVYYGQPVKGLSHRALADIMESIQELAYYRQTLFVPPPGPSTQDVQDTVARMVAAAAAADQAVGAVAAPETHGAMSTRGAMSAPGALEVSGAPDAAEPSGRLER